MTATRVALRADATAARGIGHVARCVALAQALQDCGCETVLVSAPSEVDTVGIARRAGLAVQLLPHDTAPRGHGSDTAAHGVDMAADAARTIEALAAWRPAWVVVDHYDFDAAWHAAVGEALATRVALIDDLADRSLAGDLLIDHNWAGDHRAKYAGRWPARLPLLGGPRYALLGRAYRDAARHEPGCDSVRSIGIFLGGSDSAGLSPLALAACDAAGFEGDVEVVTTRANPALPSLRHACQARARTRLTVDEPDLSAFFGRHDLHIGAGGGATWERCCLGAPTLALLCAENQRASLPALAELGVVELALDHVPASGPDWQRVAQALRCLLRDAPRRAGMAARARQLVDGLGARRVALAMARESLSLRPATLDDARRMHDWRNAPSTRAASLDDDEIAWPDHLAWLQRVLANPDRRLYAASVGCIEVGFIRFDNRAPRAVEVSLYLDPALHGLGLGGELLRRGEQTLEDGVPVHATVLPANDGSRRMFAAAGYEPQDNGCTWIKASPARKTEKRNT